VPVPGSSMSRSCRHDRPGRGNRAPTFGSGYCPLETVNWELAAKGRVACADGRGDAQRISPAEITILSLFLPGGKRRT
jgi:hypothetical protein